jgi:hypothetical protein
LDSLTDTKGIPKSKEKAVSKESRSYQHITLFQLTNDLWERSVAKKRIVGYNYAFYAFYISE